MALKSLEKQKLNYATYPHGRFTSDFLFFSKATYCFLQRSLYSYVIFYFQGEVAAPH